MKLKKIASLMLAGVMAVSMLAGCNTASDPETEEPDVPAVPSTSDAATILHDAMNGKAREMTSPVANSDLDAALKNAVDVYFQNDGYQNVSSKVDYKEVAKSNIADALVSAMNAKTNIISDLSKTDDNGKTYYSKNDKTTTVVKLYAVEASVSDAYALEQVAGQIDGSVAKLVEKSQDNEYSYAYTVSASIVTKPVTSVVAGGVTFGVKYIAVAVTQTPTKIV